MASTSDDGLLPIHIAAKNGDLQMVKSLLQNGAKVNAVADTYLKETPLLFACYNDHLDVFQYLVENKAKLHQRDCRGFESIFIAAQYGYVDILRYLIVDKKMKPNIKGECKFTPLQIASMYGKFEAVEFLVEQGADINQANSEWVQMTPLHFAAQSGNMQICKYLVEHGAKPRAKDKLGGLPSEAAENKGYTDIAEYLKSQEGSVCCTIM